MAVSSPAHGTRSSGHRLPWATWYGAALPWRVTTPTFHFLFSALQATDWKLQPVDMVDADVFTVTPSEGFIIVQLGTSGVLDYETNRELSFRLLSTTEVRKPNPAACNMPGPGGVGRAFPNSTFCGGSSSIPACNVTYLPGNSVPQLAPNAGVELRLVQEYDPITRTNVSVLRNVSLPCRPPTPTANDTLDGRAWPLFPGIDPIVRFVLPTSTLVLRFNITAAPERPVWRPPADTLVLDDPAADFINLNPAVAKPDDCGGSGSLNVTVGAEVPAGTPDGFPVGLPIPVTEDDAGESLTIRVELSPRSPPGSTLATAQQFRLEVRDSDSAQSGTASFGSPLTLGRVANTIRFRLLVQVTTDTSTGITLPPSGQSVVLLRVTAADPAGLESFVDVRVNITSLAPEGGIKVLPTSVSEEVLPDAPASTITLGVFIAPGVEWTASGLLPLDPAVGLVSSIPPWISLSAVTGEGPTVVTAVLNGTGYPQGTLRTQLQFSSLFDLAGSGGGSGGLTAAELITSVPFELFVAAPRAVLQPNQLSLTAQPGGQNTSVELVLLNAGSFELTYTLSVADWPSTPWLFLRRVDPATSAVLPTVLNVTSGTVPQGGLTRISVQANPRLLTTGLFTASLAFTSSDPAAADVTLPVTLRVSWMAVCPDMVALTAAPDGFSSAAVELTNLSPFDIGLALDVRGMSEAFIRGAELVPPSGVEITMGASDNKLPVGEPPRTVALSLHYASGEATGPGVYNTTFDVVTWRRTAAELAADAAVVDPVTKAGYIPELEVYLSSVGATFVERRTITVTYTLLEGPTSPLTSSIGGLRSDILRATVPSNTPAPSATSTPFPSRGLTPSTSATPSATPSGTALPTRSVTPTPSPVDDPSPFPSPSVGASPSTAPFRPPPLPQVLPANEVLVASLVLRDAYSFAGTERPAGVLEVTVESFAPVVAAIIDGSPGVKAAALAGLGDRRLSSAFSDRLLAARLQGAAAHSAGLAAVMADGHEAQHRLRQNVEARFGSLQGVDALHKRSAVRRYGAALDPYLHLDTEHFRREALPPPMWVSRSGAAAYVTGRGEQQAWQGGSQRRLEEEVVVRQAGAPPSSSTWGGEELEPPASPPGLMPRTVYDKLSRSGKFLVHEDILRAQQLSPSLERPTDKTGAPNDPQHPDPMPLGWSPPVGGEAFSAAQAQMHDLYQMVGPDGGTTGAVLGTDEFREWTLHASRAAGQVGHGTAYRYGRPSHEHLAHLDHDIDMKLLTSGVDVQAWFEKNSVWLSAVGGRATEHLRLWRESGSVNAHAGTRRLRAQPGQRVVQGESRHFGVPSLAKLPAKQGGRQVGWPWMRQLSDMAPHLDDRRPAHDIRDPVAARVQRELLRFAAAGSALAERHTAASRRAPRPNFAADDRAHWTEAQFKYHDGGEAVAPPAAPRGQQGNSDAMHHLMSALGPGQGTAHRSRYVNPNTGVPAPPSPHTAPHEAPEFSRPGTLHTWTLPGSPHRHLQSTLRADTGSIATVTVVYEGPARNFGSDALADRSSLSSLEEEALGLYTVYIRPLRQGTAVLRARVGGEEVLGSGHTFTIQGASCPAMNVTQTRSGLECECQAGFSLDVAAVSLAAEQGMSGTGVVSSDAFLRCRACEPGFEKAASGNAPACDVCPFNTYSAGATMGCQPCLDSPGASCAEGVLVIKPGFWYEPGLRRPLTGVYGVRDEAVRRNVSEEVVVLDLHRQMGVAGGPNGTLPAPLLVLPAGTVLHQCPLPEVCQLDPATQAPVCATGYSGPLCAVCADGFESNNGQAGAVCNECPAQAVNIVITIVVFGVVVFGVTRVALGQKAAERSMAGKSPTTRTMTIVRIGINWMQATAVVGTMQLAGLSRLVEGALALGSAAEGVTLGFFPVRCLTQLDFYTTFYTYLSLPLLALLVPHAVSIIAWAGVVNGCCGGVDTHTSRSASRRRRGGVAKAGLAQAQRAVEMSPSPTHRPASPPRKPRAGAAEGKPTSSEGSAETGHSRKAAAPVRIRRGARGDSVSTRTHVQAGASGVGRGSPPLGPGGLLPGSPLPRRGRARTGSSAGSHSPESPALGGAARPPSPLRQPHTLAGSPMHSPKRGPQGKPSGSLIEPASAPQPEEDSGLAGRVLSALALCKTALCCGGSGGGRSRSKTVSIASNESRLLLARYLSRGTTSSIVLLFLLHFTLLRNTTKVFVLYPHTIGGRTYLANDFTATTSDAQYMTAFGLALASVVVYVMGIPAIGVAVLLHNRERLNSGTFAARFGFLYAGLRRERGLYLWEGVVLLRKIALVFIATFATTNALQQGYLATLLIIIALVLQIRFEPYEHKVVNQLEASSLSTLLFTQLGVLYYASTPTLAVSAVVLSINCAMALLFLVALATASRKAVLARTRSALLLLLALVNRCGCCGTALPAALQRAIEDVRRAQVELDAGIETSGFQISSLASALCGACLGAQQAARKLVMSKSFRTKPVREGGPAATASASATSKNPMLSRTADQSTPPDLDLGPGISSPGEASDKSKLFSNPLLAVSGKARSRTLSSRGRESIAIASPGSAFLPANASKLAGTGEGDSEATPDSRQGQLIKGQDLSRRSQQLVDLARAQREQAGGMATGRRRGASKSRRGK